MKTILIILLTVLIIFFQLQAHSETSIDDEYECRNAAMHSIGELNKLQKDVLAFSTNRHAFAKNSHAFSNKEQAIDDCEMALKIYDELNIIIANTEHLYDIIRIRGIMTNTSERAFANSLAHEHTQYMTGLIDLNINAINQHLFNTHSPALVSLCNQIKAELSKVQYLLTHID